MYNDNYGFKSGINDTIRADLADVVGKAVGLRASSGPLRVMDIGCNDGTLLSNYPTSYFRVGVDPIRKFTASSREHADHVVTEFYSYDAIEDVLPGGKADIITIISCFYDMEHPNEFVEQVEAALASNGVCVIQQNYLFAMLRQNAYDNICHEHVEYYSLLALESLLNRNGLEVFGIQESGINGGSFRTYVSHAGAYAPNGSVQHMRDNESMLKGMEPYVEFGKRITVLAEQLHTFISSLKRKGKTIYVLGASTRGNTLLQYSQLDGSLISAAMERNPDKVGCMIASLQIPIVGEEEARAAKPDYMLVLPWFFADEIIRREQDYLDQGGHFILPLPELKIV